MFDETAETHVLLRCCFTAASLLVGRLQSQPPQPSNGPRAGAAGRACRAQAARTRRGAALYVSDETGGNVIVVDPEAGTVVERIAVGKRPRGIRLSRDGKQLLVALSGSPIAGPGVDESKLPPPDRAADGIGVVDLATHKLVRTHHSGQDPESFDISLDGTKVYVSNEDAAEMSVLDLTNGHDHRARHGGRGAGGGDADGRTAGLPTSAARPTNEVVAVDTAANKVAGRVKTGARPRGIAFTPDGKTAFVGNENDANITVVDATTHKAVATIKIPPTPGSADRAAADGRRDHSPTAGSCSSRWAGPSRSPSSMPWRRKFIRTIEDVGTRPWGIALSADGTQAVHRERRLGRRLGRRRRNRQGREAHHDRRQPVGRGRRGHAPR